MALGVSWVGTPVDTDGSRLVAVGLLIVVAASGAVALLEKIVW